MCYSLNGHAFPVVDHFDHWMIALEQLKALQGYDTIAIGHDKPVNHSAIDSTITYVKRAREIYAASADAKAYSESQKAAFPTGSWPAWSISPPSFITLRVVRRPRKMRRAGAHAVREIRSDGLDGLALDPRNGNIRKANG
jgi:hypothetical protein